MAVRITSITIARWLIAGLLLHGFVVMHHAVAMVTGIEICSADASRRGADGAGGPGAHAGHDSCCAAYPAPPMTVIRIPDAAMQSTPPPAMPAARQRSAEWLAPLSRGPPTAL